MYIGIKRRKNKREQLVMYLYLCESKRIEGRVTNKQKYLISIKEDDLKSGRYEDLFNERLIGLDSESKQILDNKILQLLEDIRKG